MPVARPAVVRTDRISGGLIEPTKMTEVDDVVTVQRAQSHVGASGIGQVGKHGPRPHDQYCPVEGVVVGDILADDAQR